MLLKPLEAAAARISAYYFKPGKNILCEKSKQKKERGKRTADREEEKREEREKKKERE